MAKADTELLETECNREYEHYSEYRKELVEGEQKVSEGLDRSVLAVSTIALGLTTVLFKAIVNLENINNIVFLKLSWFFLVGL